MIIEGLILSGILTHNYLKETKDERHFKKNWNKIMILLRLKNNYDQYFEVLKYIPTEYGCDVILSIPNGLSYYTLYKVKDVLESNLHANIIMDWKKEKHCIYIKVYNHSDNLCLKNNVNLKWSNIIENTEKCYSKAGETFKIRKITEADYGFNLDISIPSGLDFDKLYSLKSKISSSFNAIADIKNEDFKNTVYVITKPFEDNVKYTPVLVKPWELYIGQTYYYKPVIISMKDNPHLLYSGITNSGKTVCLLTAITNLVHYYHKEIELYLAQISSKKDLRKFANVKQTKYFADTPHKAELMYKHVYDEMLRRNNLFNNVKDEYIDNIFDYNKKFKNGKLPFIYVCTDEFAAYMKASFDSKQTSEWKDNCLNYLLSIIREGRSVGIYILASLQRPDQQSLPATLKSQFNTKVVFRQSNSASSLVVCDDTSATTLKKREAYCITNEGKELMKTIYLDNNLIMEYIEKSIEKSHKFIDIQQKFNINDEKLKNNHKNSIKNEKNNKIVNIKSKSISKKLNNKIQIGDYNVTN